MVLTTGVKHLRAKKELRRQWRVLHIVISIQSMLILVYLAYNAVFLVLKGNAQTMFIVVLPLMKLCMKRVLAKTIGHLDAGMVLVMKSVELFDVLYLFKCMQATGSRMSGVLLISADVVINVFHLWHLHRRGRVVTFTMAADGHTLQTADVKDLIQIAIHAAKLIT